MEILILTGLNILSSMNVQRKIFGLKFFFSDSKLTFGLEPGHSATSTLRTPHQKKKKKMSRKRNATGSDLLTGGTRDVNPQYLHGTLTLSAANTTTSLTLGTPIVRVGSGAGNKSIIMEVLKVYVDFPTIDQEAAGATDRNMQFSFSTVDFGTGNAQFEDPRVFAQLSINVQNAFTAAGTALLENMEMPLVWDMTDGAGHGVLIATDNIFVQGNTNNQAAASRFRFKILYRFKEVSLVEYIGIVQSQQ